LLQIFFKCGSKSVYITFLTKQWCKTLKGEHGSSEKEGHEATALLSFPSIHP